MNYKTIGYKSYSYIVFYGIIEAFLVFLIVMFSKMLNESKEYVAFLIISAVLFLVALAMFIATLLEPKEKIQINENSLKLNYRNKEIIISFEDFLDANIYGKSIINKAGKLRFLTKKGIHHMENVADVDVVKSMLLQAAYTYKIKLMEKKEENNGN